MGRSPRSSGAGMTSMSSSTVASDHFSVAQHRRGQRYHPARQASAGAPSLSAVSRGGVCLAESGFDWAAVSPV